MTADSVTRFSPSFINGHYEYDITELDNAQVKCKRCNRDMRYRSSRKRSIKNAIGEEDCWIMVPRFSCRCGSTRTMHPYFLAKRKKFSLVAVQEIVTADMLAELGKRKDFKVDSANTRNSRRWTVKFLCGLRDEGLLIYWPKALGGLMAFQADAKEQRAFFRYFYDLLGEDWLIHIALKAYDVLECDLSPLRSLHS